MRHRRLHHSWFQVQPEVWFLGICCMVIGWPFVLSIVENIGCSWLWLPLGWVRPLTGLGADCAVIGG